MFQIFQRSQYNSNSQLFSYHITFNVGVSNISKISIQQQFTTLPQLEQLWVTVFQIFQRSQYNSNSQQLCSRSIECNGCFKYFKDLNTTAIHNLFDAVGIRVYGVSNISKISIQQQFTTIGMRIAPTIWVFQIFQRSQYNSNSQPAKSIAIKSSGCFKYFKDLNTTAIHNPAFETLPP